MTKRQKARTAMTALASIACATQASGATAPWTLDANLGVVSDYRWRGMSLSGRKAVVQGGIDIGHESGAFVGVWGSSLPATAGRAEIDIAAGWSFEHGATSGSIGTTAYLYPALGDADYVEINASARQRFGSVEIGIAAAYAPRQKNLARRDLYVTSDATISIGAGVRATAQVGINRGPTTLTHTKLDWSLRVIKSWKGHEISIAYVGTDEKWRGDGGAPYRPGVTIGILENF